jgi:hypothetical protein
MFMGFALWIDAEQNLAWAQGTHEYRPMGTAVIAVNGQFRHSDFRQTRRAPVHLSTSFAGFFGSLVTVNEYLHSGAASLKRSTPAHLR